jgi:hypothetical protein
MYDYFTQAKAQTTSEHTLEDLKDSTLIDKEVNEVFCNVFGSYNMSDNLEDIYRDHHSHFFVDDKLFLMLEIEKRFENFGVELNEEHFNTMITVQDVFDEVKKQIKAKHE